MGATTITTCDAGSAILKNPRYRFDTLYSAAADTLAQWTILARKLISDTIAVAYTRAGSSDYTAVASAAASKTLQAGAYTVTAGTLTAGVGQWTAVAPDGDTETFTSTAADDALVFGRLGLTLTVTAVANEFETGDVITATASAQSGTPLMLYDVDGTNGQQVPIAILPYEVVFSGAGSSAIDAMFGGEFDKNRLIIDADGDASNITDAVLDLLQQAGIFVAPVTENAVLDNGAT